ncbi:MAG TPA: hypothetical protein DIT75_02320, partial [Rikenellaceae bacterium]|nr:hypothetical protein [Rikenellaceae bacterium]
RNIHIKAVANIEKASVNELVEYFGSNFPVLKKLRTDALLTLNASCNGYYDRDSGSLPPLSVQMQVPDSRIGWEGIDGEGRFDLDITAKSEGGKLTAEIPDFCLSVDGMKVSLSGTADDLLGNDPLFNINSDIHFLLDSLVNYLPDSLGITVRGNLDGSIKGDFRLSQLDPYNFSEIGLNGTLKSNGIKVNVPKDTLVAYLGETEISLGPFSHDEDGQETESEHHHHHTGLSAKIDSLFAEYGSTTFIRGTGLELSAHNAEESMGGDIGRHPIHGHLDISSIGMMDLDSCFVGALRSANTFVLTQNVINRHIVPFLSLSSHNNRIAVREGVNRFSVKDAKFAIAAHPNSVERQIRRKHFLDSLQREYPNVKRDSLFKEAFRKRVGAKLPDFLSEKDFEKNDIKIQLGESLAGYVKDWDINGEIIVAEGLVITPYFPLENRITGFQGTITNNTIDIKKLSLKAGASDISANGHLSGMRRFMTSGRGRLNLDLGINSEVIDVNEILQALNSGKRFTPPGRNTALTGIDDDDYLNSVKEQASSDTTITSTLIVLPSNLNAKISLKADTIRYSDLLAGKISSNLEMKERCLQLTKTMATTNMGNVSIEGFYSTKTKKDLKAGFDLRLDGITAEKVIRLFPAVDSIVPMLKAFKGLLDCEVAATTEIDTAMNIVLPTLSGVVRVDGRDLSLAESDELNKLRRTLMFRDKDSSHIESISIRGIIKDNQLEVFPFLLNIDRYSIAASGLQRFDQKFKYHLSALKSPVPFKFGINLDGSFDDWRWKLGKTKYKSRNIPLFDTQVERMRLNLVSAIRNIFEKGVEQAIRQNQLSQKVIESKKRKMAYSSALTEDLSTEEKKTLQALEKVAGSDSK